MVNLWKVPVEEAKGTSPGNQIPNNENLGRNKEGRKSPEHVRAEIKEDIGQEESQPVKKGNICT